MVMMMMMMMMMTIVPVIAHITSGPVFRYHEALFGIFLICVVCLERSKCTVTIKIITTMKL